MRRAVPRLSRFGDEDYRRWFARLGMDGLARFQNSKSAVGEKVLPAFHRSEIPGRGVRELLAESSPRAQAPSVRVRLVATRCDGVERLNNERSARIEERRRAAYHVLNRLLADQREIGNDEINADIEATNGDVLVRHYPELSATSLPRLLDERGDCVDADCADAVLRK